ncbi:hypothetical protein ACPA9J_34690 [Pseudomonas aeruginosa]
MRWVSRPGHAATHRSAAAPRQGPASITTRTPSVRSSWSRRCWSPAPPCAAPRRRLDGGALGRRGQSSPCWRADSTSGRPPGLPRLRERGGSPAWPGRRPARCLFLRQPESTACSPRGSMNRRVCAIVPADIHQMRPSLPPPALQAEQAAKTASPSRSPTSPATFSGARPQRLH